MSGINPIQGNLLLQGVANASPWLTTEELLAPVRQNSLLAREAMLNRQAEQEMRGQDIEMIARASAYLDSLPDTAARQAAYPGVVQTLQQQGFAKNAPSVYPGDERIKALAAMGTPAKDLLEAANVQRALAGSGTTQYQTPPVGTGTTAGTTLAIPPRGTGGPGASVQMPPEYLQYFREASAETGIPMDLLIAQARQESSFNPNARGAAGEIGIFQIKPSTAANPGFGMAGVDAATLNDPRANILFGAQYLKARGGANADFNDPRVQAAALAAYNGGGDPNYVANVFRYRPGLSPGDPAARVTTYAAGGEQQPPVRGVAARTGGTDVAGPGAGTGGATATGGATTAATAQQPPAATTAAPGISPPSPPQPTNGNGLTPAQQQTIDTERALIRTREQGNAWLAKQQQYRDANVTAQRQYQADQLAYQNAVLAQRSDVRQETASQIAQRKAQIDEEAAAQARDKAKRDAKFTGAPTGYQWSEDGSTLVQSPGFQGTDKDERLDWRLDHGDPNSAQYAADYAAKKWQVSQAGNVIENDMSMYRPPAQPVQRPTYLPQPTPASLDKVRETTTDANVIVQNIDNYLKVLGETDGATIGAFLSNPRDPKAQKLLGAFDAMKMAMRGQSAMNTGVLQPAEMKMLQDDLVSPQTVRGFTGTPEAAGARLGQIKLSILRRADAELRSVGKDGILMRSAKEYQALPSGAQYYDEDGNRRTKE